MAPYSQLDIILHQPGSFHTMPSAADFRRGFGLNKNHPLGQGLTITESHVGHEVKEQNERYEFPITLLVAADSSGGGRHVLAAWKELVGRKQKQIIYSAYGSPYECSISATPKVQSLGDGILELTSIGQARRRRDVPTQAQEKQARPPAGEPSSGQPCLGGAVTTSVHAACPPTAPPWVCEGRGSKAGIGWNRLRSMSALLHLRSCGSSCAAEVKPLQPKYRFIKSR